MRPAIFEMKSHNNDDACCLYFDEIIYHERYLILFLLLFYYYFYSSIVSETVTENKNQLQINVQHAVKRVQKYIIHTRVLRKSFFNLFMLELLIM